MIDKDTITSYIQEWFADYTAAEGVKGLAEVYATVISEAKAQVLYFSDEFIYAERGDK